MKLLNFLIITFIAAISLVSCGSLKEKNNASKEYVLIENPSFKIIDSYYQHWAAGVQGGGSGTNLTIKLDNFVKGVAFKNLFFQGKLAPLKKLINNSVGYQASFKEENSNEIIMDGDVINEISNTPPVKIPFDLNENDAVVSYIENGNLKFFKISALKEKPMIAYPSANPNNKQ